MSHSGFWKALLPMEEQYTRALNFKARRFAPILPPVVPADQRDVVNELGFLLFVSAVELRKRPKHLRPSVIKERVAESFNYVARMAHHSPRRPTLGKSDVREGTALADRLFSYFSSITWDRLLSKPLFPGCGWLDDAEGDVLADATLYEVKAGERHFRSIDVRQTLAYCALNFSAKRYEIENICLLNPRSGVYFQDSIEGMCQKMAGSTAGDVLSEIVNYVTEPISREINL